MNLGKYQLIAEVARGGMGIVYLARVPGPARFSKLLIVKELKSEFADDEVFLSMFLEEARIAARLDHPNIVQTLEVGNHGDRYYIAMEYLQGQPLERLRQSGTDIPENALLRILSEALRGLHHAHTLKDYDKTDLGLVHRDVSPTNIFVTYDGQVKVVDFGIAKAADTQLETAVGVVKGKAKYMAPEQFEGKHVDARADLYAVGIMMCELISRQRLWKGVSSAEMVRKVQAHEVPSIRSLKADIEPELARICDKAMHPDRAERYASAEAMRLELDAYLTTRRDVPSMRDIGDLIAQRYAADREAVRVQLEAALAHPRASALSVFPQRNAARSPSGSDIRAPAPEHETEIGTVLQSQPVSPDGPGSNRRWPLAIGAVVAITLLGIGVGAVWKDDAASTPTPAPTPAPTPTPTEATPAPSPSLAPAETFVHVRFEGVPAHARLFLDDVLLGGNPYTGTAPRNERHHSLRVEAAGFASSALDVSLAHDVNLTVKLEPLEPPRPEAPPPRRPKASPAPSSPERPAPNCNPPYFVDERGIRRVRSECL